MLRKKIVLFIILGVLLYAAIDFVYWAFPRLFGYITFTAPLRTASKIVILVFFAVILVYRSSWFTPTAFARKMIRAAPALITIFFVLPLLFYTASNKKGVVQVKPWQITKHSWEAAEEVTTTGYFKLYRGRSGPTHRNLVMEYRVHFKDGSSINIWDDISSLARIDTYVKSRGIRICHDKVSENIDNNLSKYVNGDVNQARTILGLPGRQDRSRTHFRFSF